jgi:hypothetical protein
MTHRDSHEDALKRLGDDLAERARRLETLTAGEREWIAASTGDWQQTGDWRRD